MGAAGMSTDLAGSTPTTSWVRALRAARRHTSVWPVREPTRSVALSAQGRAGGVADGINLPRGTRVSVGRLSCFGISLQNSDAWRS